MAGIAKRMSCYARYAGRGERSLANIVRSQQIRARGRVNIGAGHMKPLVAVIAPGMMGPAVGQRLVAHGPKVRTSPKGRRPQTIPPPQGPSLVSARGVAIPAPAL